MSFCLFTTCTKRFTEPHLAAGNAQVLGVERVPDQPWDPGLHLHHVCRGHGGQLVQARAVDDESLAHAQALQSKGCGVWEGWGVRGEGRRYITSRERVIMRWC
jgi:hypothetical protein